MIERERKRYRDEEGKEVWKDSRKRETRPEDHTLMIRGMVGGSGGVI